MLEILSAKDFTIIEQLSIDFSSGMTVITGETGAGKSIIIDTLELALGARADSSVIKEGKERSEITASFNLDNLPHVREWLKTQDLDSENECLIRRIITKDGHSKNSINNTPCTLQLLRELGSILVNIHGQNEHQSLLKTDRHRTLLDNFANHKELCAQIQLIYAGLERANSKLLKLQELTQNQNAQVELLNYQLKELNDLALANNELEELHQEHKQLTNAEQLISNCNSALNIINNHHLTTAHSQLSAIKDIDTNLNATYELLNNAIIQIEESSLELRRYLDNLELNPERLQYVEQRLNTIYDLARKHRVKPEELNDLHLSLTTKLQQLEHCADDLKHTEQEITKLTSAYRETANKLTISREKAAERLTNEITAQMAKLNMPHAKFMVNLCPNKDHSLSMHGLEQVEFLVSTNPGQSLQALNKVASGGELSRISLAIQVATAQKYTTPTLIFDEVDVGIGGKTAEIIGLLLRQLGETTQVICVTHLPQVATKAHHHLLVNKSSTATATSAEVIALSPKARINEIARMLGGIKITEQTLAHAKSMFKETCKK